MTKAVPIVDQPQDGFQLEAVTRLGRDMKAAAKTMSADEARFLVDSYYAMQADRIRSTNQVRALTQSEEPHQVLSWLADNSGMLERSIASALDTYSNSSLLGRWARSITGIGPIITAGLLAHIEMEPWRCMVAREDEKKKACTEDKPHGPRCAKEQISTVGHIWRFAGLDPTDLWEKGHKRPWNASLKTLCWKLGESFVKVSGHEDDFYGHLYAERKVQEQTRNFNGLYVEQARAKLEKFKIGHDTVAYVWYSGQLTAEQGMAILEEESLKREAAAKRYAVKNKADGIPGLPMLPPDHIHSRAKRYAVKLFLSHYHAVAHRDYFGVNAPKPYILTRDQGHAHEIKCPKWPFVD